MRAYTLFLPSWGKGLIPEELQYEKPWDLQLSFLPYTISVIHELPKTVNFIFLKCKVRKGLTKNYAYILYKLRKEREVR